jgi:phosphate uptake regulator
MFKELFRAMKGSELLEQMCREFIGMVKSCRTMYGKIVEVLRSGEEATEALEQEIHDIDVTVNQAERRIRKRVVEHLSISPGQDLPLSLVLMSVSKDVERVGDYCKNLVEAAALLPGRLDEDDPGKEVLTIFDHVSRTFPEVIEAFEESDADTGREVLLDEIKVSDRCDELIEEVARSGMGTQRAVALVLLLRHVKRIDAHLSNVASAAVMPVHKLDFFDEKWKKRPADDISGD